jgi:hypothetical protein
VDVWESHTRIADACIFSKTFRLLLKNWSAVTGQKVPNGLEVKSRLVVRRFREHSNNGHDPITLGKSFIECRET